MTRITPQTAAIQRAVLAVKDRLAEASIDEIISHDELRKLLPKNLGVTHYLVVQRAQRLLNAENGAVFATVHGEGYRRLSNTVGADYASNSALIKIRNQSKKGQRVTGMAIEFANDATDSDKRRVYQKLATLGLIEHLTHKRSVQSMPDKKPVRHDPLAGLREMLGVDKPE